MNRKQALLVKILLIIFTFNTLYLCLYFSSQSKAFPSNTKPRRSLAGNRLPLTENRLKNHLYSKPWPILPSYLPWTHFVASVGSCEAYFGNGFTLLLDLLKPRIQVSRKIGGNVGGWFRCWYSETLRSSICEGGRLRMWPEKISMSEGGETLEEVIGRSEDKELPEFENGSFEIDGGRGFKGERNLVDQVFLDRYLPQGDIQRHTMRGLIGTLRIVEEKKFQCQEWVEEPTIFVTRFEYANLFHTVTDWYSAYVASRVTGLPNPPHLIFVDGHCKAPLEETWKALFSSVRYAKNFTSSVCFRHAIYSPLGYETALFKGLTEEIDCHGGFAQDLWQNPDNHKTARLSEFGEMIRAAFGFPVNKHIKRKASVHNILFVRREDYLAHPRHGGKVESRLSNEQEVYDSLQNWVSNFKDCNMNLVNGLFAHMPMKEQVRAIQSASVIIGAHGAGLTHIVSALPKTVILEIVSSQYRRPHFALIAKWKGLEYHAIYLDGSSANPEIVTDKLSSIIGSLGC